MTKLPHITLKKDIHRKQEVIRIEFTYNLQLKDILHKNTTARWSRTMKCWYSTEKDFKLDTFLETFKKLATIDYLDIKISVKPNILQPVNRDYSHRQYIKLPKGYVELLVQKRYSDSTIKTYSAYFKDFMHYFSKEDLTKVANEEINAYVLELLKDGIYLPVSKINE